MTKKFTMKAGALQLLVGAIKRFDILLKTFGLATPAQIIKGTVSIPFTFAYPDPVHDTAYYWAGGFPDATHVSENAVLLATLVSGDWNKDAPSPNTLPDILLGTVPPGTDFLDVQVDLTRTTNPSNIFGDPIKPYILGSGKVINAWGGSCFLERCYPLTRGFEIVLVPNVNPLLAGSVYLRRFQSIAKPNISWSGSNNPADSGVYTWGSQKGVPVSLIDYIAFYTRLDPSHVFINQRGGPSGITTADTTDYTSVYSGIITITPGFFDVPPAPPTPVVPFVVYNEGRSGNTAGIGSVSLATVQFSTPATGRRVVVTVQSGFATSSPTAPSPDVSGVVIAGVTAAKIVGDSSAAGLGTRSAACSMWMATVPTGLSGTVAVTFAQPTHNYQVDCYSLYNLASSTPDNTQSVKVSPDSVTLTTHADGVAIAAYGMNDSTHPPALAGIDNITEAAVSGSASGFSFNLLTGIGYQLTTGSSLTISELASGAGNFPRILIAASFH